jgi:hypothetical protein
LLIHLLFFVSLGLGAVPEAVSAKYKTSLEAKAQKRSLGRGGRGRRAGRAGSDDDSGSSDDEETGSLSKGMTPTSGKVISAGTKRVRERVQSETMNLERLQEERKQRKKGKQRKKHGIIDPDE